MSKTETNEARRLPDDFPDERDVEAAFDALKELDWTVPAKRLEAALWAVAEARNRATTR